MYAGAVTFCSSRFNSILCLLLAPVDAFAQQVVGSVTRLSGSAQLARGTATQTVALGTQIELHDRLSTEADSSVTVTLNDGSTGLERRRVRCRANRERPGPAAPALSPPSGGPIVVGKFAIGAGWLNRLVATNDTPRFVLT
jgi:hypothetical protein